MPESGHASTSRYLILEYCKSACKIMLRDDCDDDVDENQYTQDKRRLSEKQKNSKKYNNFDGSKMGTIKVKKRDGHYTHAHLHRNTYTRDREKHANEYVMQCVAEQKKKHFTHTFRITTS